MDSCLLRAMAPWAWLRGMTMVQNVVFTCWWTPVHCVHRASEPGLELPPLSASRSSYGTDDDIKCRLYLLMDSCSLRAMAPVSLASSSPLSASRSSQRCLASSTSSCSSRTCTKPNRQVRKWMLVTVAQEGPKVRPQNYVGAEILQEILPYLKLPVRGR